MAQYTRIPLLKNQITFSQAKKKSKRPLIFLYVVCIFFLMIMFVWLKIETNVVLAEIQKAEITLSESRIENEKLKAEVLRYSDRERIKEIASTRLGLSIVSNEKVITVQKN